MKIDFMILGAQKCGTTTLFDILNSHPKVSGSSPKEPHFFSTTPDWKKNLGEYYKIYDQQKENVLRFEASTDYTFYPYRNLNIWDTLHEINPEMKHIYIVRNPKQRIVSAYMHMFSRGYLDLPIDEALLEEKLLIGVSRYYTQIKPFIDKFGRDKVLLLDFADLVKDVETTVEKVAAFLGISMSDFPADYQTIRSNVSLGNKRGHHKLDKLTLPQKVLKKVAPSVWYKMSDNSDRSFAQKPSLSAAQQQVVVDLLDLEILEIEKLLGKDLSSWRVIS
ncbi:MAG: sulfotransferase [Anaerolineae bacterium]